MKQHIIYLAFITQVVFAQLPTDVQSAIQAAYSCDTTVINKTLDQIKDTKFATEGHRKLLLIQAYSSSEEPEHLEEAIKIATEYLTVGTEGWIKDFIKMQLVSVLALNGQRKESNKLAESILAEFNLNSFASVNDPLLASIAKRFGRDVEYLPIMLKDELLSRIGYYYLNRDFEDGGPDVQMATNIFSEIKADGNRKNCLADYRLIGMKPDGTKIPFLKEDIASSKSVVAPDNKEQTPHNSQEPAVESNLKVPTTQRNSLAAILWTSIVVLIVVVLILLKLLLDKKK